MGSGSERTCGFQKHTDTRGSIGSVNAAPVVNFSTANQRGRFRRRSGFPTRHPGRPTIGRRLQSTINFLLGRVGSVTQGLRASRDRRMDLAARCFDFAATLPRDRHSTRRTTWKPRREPHGGCRAALRGQSSRHATPTNLISPSQPEPRRRPAPQQHAAVAGREAVRR
jgi:hypothetical protein